MNEPDDDIVVKVQLSIEFHINNVFSWEFVNERLTAAAEEIFRVFKQTIDKYEEEIDPLLEKNSIDQHQNTPYAGLAGDQSVARPAYGVF